MCICYFLFLLLFFSFFFLRYRWVRYGSCSCFIFGIYPRNAYPCIWTVSLIILIYLVSFLLRFSFAVCCIRCPCPLSSCMRVVFRCLSKHLVLRSLLRCSCLLFVYFPFVLILIVFVCLSVLQYTTLSLRGNDVIFVGFISGLFFPSVCCPCFFFSGRFPGLVWFDSISLVTIRVSSCDLVNNILHSRRHLKKTAFFLPSYLNTTTVRWEGKRVDRLRTERHPDVWHSGGLESDGFKC